uniref:gluconokinase n=1 Tax=Nocardia donostiensis TaxID=1538463 RepID=UPI0031844C84
MGERPVVIVMGVSGAGKTTVGRRLAEVLGVRYTDGDDFHPAANIAKMAAGNPLTHEDRQPWLDGLARWLRDHAEDGAVVSCSALERRYRDRLRAAAPRALFLHLVASRDALDTRIHKRTGHFMPARLLSSQLAALEPLAADERGRTVDAMADPDRIAHDAAAWVRETS